MAEQETKTLPPYLSYKAFTRFINSLREDHLPSRVDRGVLTGMSGSAQSAMINGLEALGLIDTDGRPTDRLVQLVGAAPGSPAYKAELQSILSFAYTFLFNGSINLKTTTTNEVQEAFRKQGVSGSTVAKGIAFFLSAARDAGVEISKYVRTPTIADVGAKKRTGTGRSNIIEDDDEDDEDAEEFPLGVGLDLHPALAGVLATLPAPGQPMSSKERERFLKAFDAVLSLAHPVNEEDS